MIENTFIMLLKIFITNKSFKLKEIVIFLDISVQVNAAFVSVSGLLKTLKYFTSPELFNNIVYT